MQHPRFHFAMAPRAARCITIFHAPDVTMPNHAELKTVTDLKLPRYLGTWYEIARLPMRHEPEGCTDVSANYSLQDDGNVRVHNR